MTPNWVLSGASPLKVPITKDFEGVSLRLESPLGALYVLGLIFKLFYVILDYVITIKAGWCQ